MKFVKQIEKLAKNHTVLFTIVAAVALMYAMKMYSNGKIMGGKSGMTSAGSLSNAAFSDAGVAGYKLNPLKPPEAAGDDGAPTGTCGQGTSYQPSAGLGMNETMASVSGMMTSDHGLPASCSKQPVVDPRELLPKDTNSQFSQMNPAGAGDIQNVSLLRAGYHIGINTVGQSLRNANRQLRSEPPNPQVSVSPWMNSSIGPDLLRRPLEVGDSCGKGGPPPSGNSI